MPFDLFSNLKDRCVYANAEKGDFGYLGEKERLREVLDISQSILNLAKDSRLNFENKYYIEQFFKNNIPQIVIDQKDLRVKTLQGNLHRSITQHLIRLIDYLNNKNEEELFHQSTVNYAHIGSATNLQIQQGVSNSHQRLSIVNSALEEMGKALDNLKSEIKQEKTITSEKLESINTNIDLLKSQLFLPRELQDKTLIEKSWNYLNNFATLTSVGSFCHKYGSMMATHLG